MVIEETVNDRIEQIINQRFAGNKTAFCNAVGWNAAGISSYLGKQRRSKPSIDMITKIITALDIDPKWLLTGEETVKVEIKEAHRDIREVDNKAGIYNEVSGDYHGEQYIGGNQYHGSCAEEKTEAEKEISELKSQLIEAQKTIIELMREKNQSGS